MKTRKRKTKVGDDSLLLLLLPSEICSDIFMRLPIKSILQCRSVCKSWYSLISNPNFIDNYENLDKSGNHLFLSLRDGSTSNVVYSFISHDNLFVNPRKHDRDFPERFRSQSLQVVGSCNGLICLCLLKYGEKDYSVFDFLIWNPAIRKIVELPSRTFSTRSKDCSFKFNFGFGFDSKTSDYKVLFVLEQKCEIFDLRKRVWRTIAPTVFNSICGHNCYVNGAVHWIGRVRRDGISYENNIILAFDMSEEVFRQITMPNYRAEFTGDNMLSTNIVTFGGLIYVIVWELRADGGIVRSESCSVWAMKEYGVAESWSKVLDIDLRSFQAFSSSICSWMHSFCFLGNGEVVMVNDRSVVEDDALVYKQDLVSYNIESRKYKRIKTDNHITGLCLYKESLVLM